MARRWEKDEAQMDIVSSLLQLCLCLSYLTPARLSALPLWGVQNAGHEPHRLTGRGWRSSRGRNECGTEGENSNTVPRA